MTKIYENDERDKLLPNLITGGNTIKKNLFLTKISFYFISMNKNVTKKHAK
jgi:hypothetical protein